MTTQQIADKIDNCFSSEDARKTLLVLLGGTTKDAAREILKLIRADLEPRYSNGKNWRIDAVDCMFYANGGVEVGMGATRHGYSDAEAYTVIEVNKAGTVLVLQRDKATLSPDFKPNFIPGGFVGHVTNNREQSYTYERDPNGDKVKVRLRKDGLFYPAKSKMSITIGYRSEYYDYNF